MVGGGGEGRAAGVGATKEARPEARGEIADDAAEGVRVHGSDALKGGVADGVALEVDQFLPRWFVVASDEHDMGIGALQALGERDECAARLRVAPFKNQSDDGVGNVRGDQADGIDGINVDADGAVGGIPAAFVKRQTDIVEANFCIDGPEEGSPALATPGESGEAAEDRSGPVACEGIMKPDNWIVDHLR